MITGGLKIYGGVASPFARRVWYVLHQLEIPFEAVNTLAQVGQAQMRAVNPLWKVPCIEVNGLVLWDSQTIIEYLLEKYADSPKWIRLPQGNEYWREKKLVSAVNAAVESSINLVYLQMDGVGVEQVAYLKKQRARIDSILSWLKSELIDNYFTITQQVGLSEMTFYCLLDYLRMRNLYPLGKDPVLSGYLDFHADNPSFVATQYRG